MRIGLEKQEPTANTKGTKEKGRDREDQNARRSSGIFCL
jgi:hypothetical protein